jgi:rubrerythrin
MEDIISTTPIPRDLLQCPKCKYQWYGRILPNKVYFQCPMCKAQFKKTG